jgi:hypothetical protein
MKNKNILALLLVVILTGCSGIQKRENREIDPVFFTKPSSVLITEISDFKPPYYNVHVEDNHSAGLIGALVTGITRAIAESANEEASQAVRNIILDPILSKNYYDPFKRSLESRGCSTKALYAPLLLKELAEIDANHSFAPFDFRHLKELHNVDYALVANPARIGITRFPGLFGKSIKNITVYFYLVNLSDNSIVGYFDSTLDNEVIGDWDVAPYTLLTKGLEEALAKAFDDAHMFFFKTSILQG